MHKPIVYVPHETMFRDENGKLHPKHDLRPAISFGQLQLMTPHGRLFTDKQIVVAVMRQAMPRYTTNDYILLTGDPVAIGVACALAALDTGGKVRLLQWDRITKTYTPLDIDLLQRITEKVNHGG